MIEDDTDIRAVLDGMKTVAVVGLDTRTGRPAHIVAEYLQRHGRRVIPVNERDAGKIVLGETVMGSLAELAATYGDVVDTVDIFRRSEQVGPVVDAALEVLPGLKTVWMQLDIIDEAAAARARARGVTVVMDRCPKIEMQRLGME